MQNQKQNLKVWLIPKAEKWITKIWNVVIWSVMIQFASQIVNYQKHMPAGAQNWYAQKQQAVKWWQKFTITEKQAICIDISCISVVCYDQ